MLIKPAIRSLRLSICINVTSIRRRVSGLRNGTMPSSTNISAIATANVADTIVRDAMRTEFGAAKMQRITAPHMGYKATKVAAEDTLAVLAFRIQAKGARRDGSTSRWT